MANTKATRKKYSPLRKKAVHVTNVLNRVMHKFYMMGDMNHDPMSFHIADLKLHLKGADRDLALQEVCKFLYAERRTWVLAIYHFFKIDDKLDVVPTVITLSDSLLNEAADSVEEYIRASKEAVMDPSDGHTEENHIFYGYYINYGDNLLLSEMEQDIISALMKVNKDFSDVKPEVCECNAEKVLRAIAGEKFSLVNSKALTSDLVETE
ncbi:hypothetical protein pETSU_123 [Edwardsiella phage pEt-SU]|uniref:Uncharacterized protein n=1 Tax=Edwardsiella phage pEt-SU TaxID=2562142 RepID=A0A4D6DWL9_9CAUD|nr:hypothetical protein HOV39_gp123 [Edwardsiella phage pEt-SU]QBZ70704.1 hypothetical protein pETSU_123 [Edwardsiella phage pEt-SU]